MPRVVPSQVVTVIDQIFPNIKDQEKGRPIITLEPAHTTAVAGILDLASQLPPEFLPAEASRYTEYVVALAALRQAMAMWESHGSGHTVVNISGFGYSPIFLIRRALADVRDELPCEETPGLDFISDPEFKKVLRTDLSSAFSALRNGEWKAAAVLAGSVIEALLLWHLRGHDTAAVRRALDTAVNNGLRRPRSSNLDDWHLPDYIAIAAELACVEKGTIQEVNRAKEYRNLIHPGAAIRTGQACDLGAAHITVGAADHVVRDLAGKGANHE